MRARSTLLGAAVLTAATLAAGAAWAVDVRDARLQTIATARFVRAYAPCVVPNDQTVDGVAACSPPVTPSSCGFLGGDLRLSTSRSHRDRNHVRLRVFRLDGSGTCRSGLYSLRFDVRVTADDPACAGGSCTFEDLAISKSFIRRDAGGLDFELAEILPAGFDQANVEIRGVSIIDPDGHPLATSGLSERLDLSRTVSNLTLAQDECEVPNTTGALGAACSPPARTAVCDYDEAGVEFEGKAKKGLLWKAEVENLVGAPECVNGTYHLRPTLRITSARCGDGSVPCTTVDTPVDFPIVARKGHLQRKLVTPGVSLPRDHVEVVAVRLVEPSGATLATRGLGHAPPLQKTQITVRRKPVPNGDILRVNATFPTTKIYPTAEGVTFTLRDRDGVAYTATIPGSLWQKGSSWKYSDKTKSIGGIRSAKISRGKVKLAAFGVDLSGADQPSQTLEITIVSALSPTPTKASQQRTCHVKAAGLICR